MRQDTDEILSRDHDRFQDMSFIHNSFHAVVLNKMITNRCDNYIANSLICPEAELYFLNFFHSVSLAVLSSLVLPKVV